MPNHDSCFFAAPITVGRAACRHATEVVRRGGSEYDCVSACHHVLCGEIYAGLKWQGLAALGVDDDPSTMPHSVLVKVQTGGLAGLARLTGQQREDSVVADISELVAAAVQTFGAAADVPYSDLSDDIRGCRLDRRTRRRGR